MGSLVLDVEPSARRAHCTDTELIVELNDGRTLSIPIVWFPRLANASSEEREQYELLGSGEGIHWPAVDEDVSILGLLAGKPAVDYVPE